MYWKNGTRGRWDEFRAMLNFYGNEVVKNELLNTRYLDKRTLAYCSPIFDVTINQFRCCKLAQPNPELRNYLKQLMQLTLLYYQYLPVMEFSTNM